MENTADSFLLRKPAEEANTPNPIKVKTGAKNAEKAKSPFSNLLILDQSGQGDLNSRELPDDFAERFANKIVLIHDGQSTRRDAINRLTGFIRKHIDSPQMFQEFIKSIYILSMYADGKNIIELILSAIIYSYDGGNSFCNQFMEWLIDANKRDQKFLDLEFEDEKTNTCREYISDAVIGLCDLFLHAADAQVNIRINLQKFCHFMLQIDKEKNMVDARIAEDPEFIEKHFQNVEYTEKKNLFFLNEMLRYLNLVSNNIFSERLTSSNAQSARATLESISDQKLSMLREWQNELNTKSKVEEIHFQNQRHSNPQEIEIAYDVFKKMLSDFRDEVRYNPCYIMLGYLRVFLISFNLLLGFLGGLLGLLGVWGLTIIEGGTVTVLMILFSLVTQSKLVYKNYQPKDRYYDIRNNLPLLNESIKRMSYLQLISFLERQVEDPDNYNNFVYIPNFLGFIGSGSNGKVFKFLNPEDLKKAFIHINKMVTKKRWHLLSTY